MSNNSTALAPTLELITVTPALALDWLSSRAPWQRDISKASVRQLANKIRRGDWKPTPSAPIAITNEKEVLDGQHRLSALAEAGSCLPMYVLFNAPRDTFDVIDRGRSRTLTQIAKMAGCKMSQGYQLATAHSLLWRIDSTASTSAKFNEADIQDILEHYEWALEVVVPKGTALKYRSAHFKGAALRALISRPDRADDIQDFLYSFTHGEPSDYSHPEKSKMALRLKAAVTSKHFSECQKDKHLFWTATLNCLRHYLDGTEIVHVNNILNRNHAIKVQPFPIALDKKPPHQSIRSWIKSGGK